MMKKKILVLIFVIVIIILLAFLFFIKKERDANSVLKQLDQQNLQETNVPSNTGLPSENEISTMKNDYKQIDEYVKTLKTIGEVRLALPTLNSYTAIEKAHIEGSNLFLKFKNGGTINYSLWNDSSLLLN